MLPALPPEAAEQRGLFSYAQALKAGWTPWQIERLVHAGLLDSPAHGVFAAAGLADGLTDVERHLLAVRARQLAVDDPGWHAGRRSAALVHSLPIIGGPPDRPQLVRDGAGSRAKGHSRHDRIARLPLDHREVVDGIATCTSPRAVVDIARAEVFRNGVVVTDAAMRAGTTREELRAVAATMRRWPGVVQARAVIEFADPRTESPGESVTRVACRAESLPIPEPQVEVWRYGRFVARLDFLYRAELLAIESNGAIKFTDAGVLPDLLERAEDIRDCGIAVLHTNWSETFRNTEAFGRRVRQRLHEGGRSLAQGVELRSTVFRLPRAA